MIQVRTTNLDKDICAAFRVDSHDVAGSAIDRTSVAVDHCFRMIDNEIRKEGSKLATSTYVGTTMATSSSATTAGTTVNIQYGYEIVRPDAYMTFTTTTAAAGSTTISVGSTGDTWATSTITTAATFQTQMNEYVDQAARQIAIHVDANIWNIYHMPVTPVETEEQRFEREWNEILEGKRRLNRDRLKKMGDARA